jgi:energy-coupling factor transporter ATP-binding protein EcfA2
MKVKNLTLTNYRGFQQLDIEFGDKMTVFAGINGSGKSAVLRALAAILSHLLPKTSPSKETAEMFSVTDVHSDKPALTISAMFEDGEKALHGQITHAKPNQAKAAEYAERRDKARFAIRTTTKGSKEEIALRDEIRFLSELLEGGKDHFSFQSRPLKKKSIAGMSRKASHPIAVLYATSRYLGRMPPRLSGLRPFEPGNAYPGALVGNEVSLGAFALWFQAALHGALGGKSVSTRLLRQLDSVVRTILPGFSEPRLTATSPPRFYVKKDRKEFELNQLSDGERGLLALAFDLTRRLSIANPELKNPVAESPAIILLDEIELHLHPKWQRDVLRRLTKTFSKSQFIVTTHSPQVLGEVEGKYIRYLKRAPKGEIIRWTPPRALGLDSNRILRELMDAPSRNTGVDARTHKLFRLIDAEKFRDAKALLSTIQASLGEAEPDVVRARALMAFLKGKK